MKPPGVVVQARPLPSEDSPLSATLSSLNEASPRPSPFFTPEFMHAYVTHNERYRPDQIKTCVLLVRERKSQQIIAALPLKRVWNRSLGVPFRQFEFLVGSEVDLPPLLAAPEHQEVAAQALMNALPRLLVGASSVQLLSQPEDGTLFRARRHAQRPWTAIRHNEGMPISGIDVTFQDIGAYYRALNKKMRSNVSRLARRLAHEGCLEYLTSSEPSAMPDLFRAYLDIERRSWKRGTGASLVRHPARALMYERLHRRPKQIVHHIDLLLKDGVPIAGQVSMHYGKTVFAMETCYDECFANLGPGNLLLFLAVTRAIRLGVSELGLHGHFDYYKHRWLCHTLATRDIRVLRRGSFPHLTAKGREVLRRLQGKPEPHAGVPEGRQQSKSQGDPPSFDQPELVERLRSHTSVTRLDQRALEAVLPFPLATK